MNDLKDMQKVALFSVYRKVVKSYALDTETIATIEKVSSDLGIKSRSETLREIVKRYDTWQETHNTQN